MRIRGKGPAWYELGSKLEEGGDFWRWWGEGGNMRKASGREDGGLKVS